jgi:UDP-GlcNAc:undecaprenyl-phosphate/decaprenyl-phosphate GlcNAc-1-phosphate transferase
LSRRERKGYHPPVRLILIPLAVFAATAVLHLAVLRWFPRLGLLDFPERYGLKRGRLPYPSGIVAPVVFLPFLFLLEPPDMQTFAVALSILLLGALSFADDRRPLPPAVRLGSQLFIVLLLFLAGDCTGGRVCSLTNPLEGIAGGPFLELNGEWPWLAFVVTAMWLLLTINAMNWFDGVPGQVTSLSLLGFATIGLLSLLRVRQEPTALLAFVLAAIAAGSALFDVRKPRVILGDSGAMFFGLMLGVLTIYSGGKLATAFLALGFPIIDSLVVILRRVAAGRSPMRGKDGEHLHNRLMAAGWSRGGVIAMTSCIGLAFGVAALFLDTKGKAITALVLGAVILGLSWYADVKKRGKRKEER